MILFPIDMDAILQEEYLKNRALDYPNVNVEKKTTC